MSTYAKQLVSEISENLDTKLVDFFNSTKTRYNYPVNTCIDLVDYVMETTLGGKSKKEDLKKLYDQTVRSRRKKKDRWVEKLNQDIKSIEHDSPKYPFSNLYAQYKILPDYQWKKLYGCSTFEEVVEQKMNEAELWKEDLKSYFIDFCCIGILTANKCFQALVSDVSFFIFTYINLVYDGSIANFFTTMPLTILGIPLFSPKRAVLFPEINGDITLSDRYEYNSNILETSVSIDQVGLGDKLLSMDDRDYMILAKAIQNLNEDFYTTKKARVSRRALAKVMNSSPGKDAYALLEEKCARIADYTYKVYSEGKLIMVFNLIDNIDLRNKDYVVFTFADTLYNSIINNELTNIKSSSIDRLEQNLSLILFQPLFNSRLVLSLEQGENADTVSSSYSYSFFMDNVRFPSSYTPKRNMDLVEESLKEFVSKQIVVKNYTRMPNNEGFAIDFFPLSEEEKADLSYKRFSLMDDINADYIS